MKKNTESKQALRSLAEQKAARLIESRENRSPEETDQLLYELLIHQIQLETQHEELRWTHAELEASRAHYFELYDLAPAAYVTLGEGELILEANLTAAGLLGSARGELVGTSIIRFIFPEDLDIYYRHRKLLFHTGEPQRCELRLLRKDGTLFWARFEAIATEDKAGATDFRAVISDITERREADEELLHAKKLLQAANRELEQALAREQQVSHIDELTGINNRRFLMELATQMYDVAGRYHHPLSLLVLELDNIKEINNTFGPGVGDRILERIAYAAGAVLRCADIMGRYGPAEFVIVLPMTTAQQAFPVAERIHSAVAAIRDPTQQGETAVTLYIGIAEMVHSIREEKVNMVINRAIEAIFAVKQAERNPPDTCLAAPPVTDRNSSRVAPPSDSPETLSDVANSPYGKQSVTPEAARNLPHELRIHQIELELQHKELQRTREELETSRANSFYLYELAPVGFITFDDQGLILKANLTAATLLGATRGALIRQPLTCFICSEDQELYHCHRRQLLTTGKILGCELRMVKRDGTRLRVRLEATAAQGGDGRPEYRALISAISGSKPTPATTLT